MTLVPDFISADLHFFKNRDMIEVESGKGTVIEKHYKFPENCAGELERRYEALWNVDICKKIIQNDERHLQFVKQYCQNRNIDFTKYNFIRIHLQNF